MCIHQRTLQFIYKSTVKIFKRDPVGFFKFPFPDFKTCRFFFPIITHFHFHSFSLAYDFDHYNKKYFLFHSHRTSFIQKIKRIKTLTTFDSLTLNNTRISHFNEYSKKSPPHRKKNICLCLQNILFQLHL